MATYPGMSLGGEVRESVSLDEDDMSDVEDEVFIRDGKNGYKFVEDAGVKRPLMAPRRKAGRSEITSRLKGRPPCKALCKPCCYVFAALVVLIGLIVLVVILVSMFPLPIEKLKSWIAFKTRDNVTVKLLPCSDLKVTDIWTVSLPKFISESPIRALDVNNDGVEDIIFGFGTALENALHPNLFCPIFMGVSPPCEGGVIALNGSNGATLWRKWFMHPISSVTCSVDVTNDGTPDCLVSGKTGILCIINSKDGTVVWQYEDITKQASLFIDVYTAEFIPDQNNDGIQDILAAHTGKSEKQGIGHLLLISGRDGKTIQKLEITEGEEIYYTPQIFNGSNGEYLVLFGTGSPISPGNLSVIPLKSIVAGNLTGSQNLYQDKFKGILSPSVLVDITGDGQVDIIMAAFNTTVIAIDGATFKQIWNFTIANSETLSIPIPGYFNSDNVTDFFIKYQTGKEFPLYYYSQAFIIDGKTGTPIYNKGINDTLGSQMGGLTLSMEGYGFDFYLYWIVNCLGFEGTQSPFKFNEGSTIKQQSNADLCKLRFNSSTTTKLYALNQYDQPPGLEIYSSENRTNLEFKNTRTAAEEASEYFRLHPENDFKTDTAEDVEELLTHNPNVNTFPIKYTGASSFRHKGSKQNNAREFNRSDNKNKNKPVTPLSNYNDNKKFEDYDQQSDWNSQSNQYNINDPTAQIYDIDTYFTEPIYNQNSQFLVEDNVQKMTNRDPRSKIEISNSKSSIDDNEETPLTELPPTDSTEIDQDKKKAKTLKKNLSETPYGIYGYKNVKLSRNRLLHDLNSSPKEILVDSFFKNRERQLRKSRFEQRDIKSHKDKLKDNEDVKKIIEHEKAAAMNISENLWDLESEKEAEDKENGYWRYKREANLSISWIPKITSMGVIVNSVDTDQNTIDLIFLTYWLPPKYGAYVILEQDEQCIAEKLKSTISANDQNINKVPLKEMIEKQCLKKRIPDPIKSQGSKQNIPYYTQISQLRMGQMTIYKLRIECVCDPFKKGERCAKFLNANNQAWSAYLGNMGDGFFKTRN